MPNSMLPGSLPLPLHLQMQMQMHKPRRMIWWGLVAGK